MKNKIIIITGKTTVNMIEPARTLKISNNSFTRLNSFHGSHMWFVIARHFRESLSSKELFCMNIDKSRVVCYYQSEKADFKFNN